MKTFTYNNLTVTAERKGHDTNGNPLYMVKPNNFEFVHCDKAYRNYFTKGYYLLMSYEINEDVPWFFRKTIQPNPRQLEGGSSGERLGQALQSS